MNLLESRPMTDWERKSLNEFVHSDVKSQKKAMTKYRVKEYDPLNNIWLLQKRFLWVFWFFVSAGSKQVVEAKVKELNSRV